MRLKWRRWRERIFSIYNDTFFLPGKKELCYSIPLGHSYCLDNTKFMSDNKRTIIQSGNKTIVLFCDTGRSYWLETITNVYELFHNNIKKSSVQVVTFDFDVTILPKDIKPFHLVTLACLIHYLKSHGLDVFLSTNNNEVFHFIYDDLGFSEYWSRGKNFVDAPGHDSIFNLWRITEEGKDLYAKRVEEYLRRTYFANKDLSAVSVGLVEAYYNVFDHAQAKGNAFSLIQYDEETSVLHVAISDFGIGIAQSVSDYDKRITNDKDAILKALEDNFTVKSTDRNKGMGLSIIIAPAKKARIFSHNGLVYKHDGVIEGFECEMSFPGTLIYYEIDLSQMDDEEIIDEFDFFN